MDGDIGRHVESGGPPGGDLKASWWSQIERRGRRAWGVGRFGMGSTVHCLLPPGRPRRRVGAEGLGDAAAKKDTHDRDCVDLSARGGHKCQKFGRWNWELLEMYFFNLARNKRIGIVFWELLEMLL